MSTRLSLLVLIVSVLISGLASAQEKDSIPKILDNKLGKELLGAVTKRNGKSLNQKNVKSEDLFMPHQGKIVRRIIFRQIDFERSIYDTTRNIRNTITRVANALHSDTRERVIRDNLFFRETRPLNPFRLADNERYLRDLDFIMDSKITVLPLAHTNDSVDIEVMTRDVFSLGARGRARGIDAFSVGIYDANLAGYGQRVQGEFLFDAGRSPLIGKGLLYSKSSVAGSLVNLSAGYTELDNARSAGEENEYAYFIRLDRPLVSPYSRLAGGAEFSRNWSMNVLNNSDSLFRRYRYNAQDYWVGYNIGIRNNIDDRSRHFVAIRYFEQHFDIQPTQENQRVRRIYNDQRFLLGELTFYNQNFYKTSYVYGFGRTEDVPYGQTVNITAGWGSEVGLRRFYVGSYASKRIVRSSGRFYDIEVGGGTFLNQDVAEDGVIYANASYYSKLYDIGRSRVRHLFQGGYSRAFNNRVRELLTLNNEINGFRPDSLFGFNRVHFRTETTVFTRHEFLGFRMAPFMSLELAYFERNHDQEINRDVFWGTTGGLRVRNENLIFGTIELRLFYFPRVVPGVDPVSVRVTTNLRIKYSGVFVRPPDFVRYNQ